jgi:F420-dependent oxidoreductase-like protein
MAVFRRGVHFGSYGTVDDGPAVFDRLGAAVETAEEAGFDAISVPDHVHQNRVGGGPDSPMFEAYTLLGALAARTSSVRLLALVSPVTMRSPGLLAKAVTTVDVLSGGRAVLGLGAGWDVAEAGAYGISFPPTGERMDRLEETLTICQAMFTEASASVSGAHYQISDARNSPRPVRGSIPILVGGGGERRTLNLVARYADACNVGGDAATVARKLGILAQHCERVGRDPGEITKTVFATAIPDDLAEFAQQLAGYVQAGAEGVVLLGRPGDTGRLRALGEVVAGAFPG